MELYLHSLSVSYGMLQNVLYFYVEYQRDHLCKTFTLNAQNGLLTSLLVASVSYHNCTDKQVTCHVIFQYYGQHYMLVTSLFRVLF